VVKFARLSKQIVGQIVDKFISELNAQIKDKNIVISLTSDAKQWLTDKGYDKKMGARPLARVIDNNLKSPLSRKILFGDLKDGGSVSVIVKDDKLDFVISELPKPLTKEQRKAVKLAKMKEQQDAEQNKDDKTEILQQVDS
jgi:ATP-dependent Clp protease ATP-binding subunit ClpA